MDETLSAFSDTLEVEHINAVFDEGLQDSITPTLIVILWL